MMDNIKRLNLIILHLIKNDYITNDQFQEHLEKYYNIERLNNDYLSLLDEFLNEYALSKAEKSE